MPSSGICLPAITARSAARAAASACRSVTSRKALSCGSLVSIRASNSFTSSTGDNRFVAIRRPASAMVRKGGVGPVIAHGGQAFAGHCLWGPPLRRGLGFGLHLGHGLGLWLGLGLRRRPYRPHRHGGADGRRQPEHTRPCRQQAAGHAACPQSVPPPAARRAPDPPLGRDSAPARRARAEAASRRG